MLQILTNRGTLIMQKAYLHNIKYALDNGYHIVVTCAEEYDTLQKATDSYKLAKEAVESTGYVEIAWCKPCNKTNTWQSKVTFLAVLACEPEYTIADWDDELGNTWSNAYDKAIYS